MKKKSTTESKPAKAKKTAVKTAAPAKMVAKKAQPASSKVIKEVVKTVPRVSTPKVPKEKKVVLAAPVVPPAPQPERIEKTAAVSVSVPVSTSTPAPAPVTVKSFTIRFPITVGNLSTQLNIRIPDLIKTLMGIGIFANVNQLLNEDIVLALAGKLGIAIEKEGETALVGDSKNCQLTRVNLINGTKTRIVGFEPCDDPSTVSSDGDAGSVKGIVIEPSGQTALVLQVGGVLWRVNLLTGEKRLISDFHPISSYYKWGLALEPSGTKAIVTHYLLSEPFGPSLGLLRVDLATGQIGTISKGLGWLRGVVVEEGGKTALAAGVLGIVRVKLVQ